MDGYITRCISNQIVHLDLFTSSVPYMSSILWATAVSSGHLDVLPQHSGSHHVHVTVKVIKYTCEDTGGCVKIDQKVRPSVVPLVVFCDLIGQQSLSKVLQVPHHRTPLH